MCFCKVGCLSNKPKKSRHKDLWKVDPYPNPRSLTNLPCTLRGNDIIIMIQPPKSDAKPQQALATHRRSDAENKWKWFDLLCCNYQRPHKFTEKIAAWTKWNAPNRFQRSTFPAMVLSSPFPFLIVIPCLCWTSATVFLQCGHHFAMVP